jgi:hypothetical protein
MEDSVQEAGVKMQIQIQRRAESLSHRDGPGAPASYAVFARHSLIDKAELVASMAEALRETADSLIDVDVDTNGDSAPDKTSIILTVVLRPDAEMRRGGGLWRGVTWCWRRVDAMLELAAGKDRHRAVIWIGRAAHDVDEKRARGCVVGEVIRERVAAFGGRAWSIDLFARSSTADGSALYELKLPGQVLFPLRTSKGFHLTKAGVKAAMFDPRDAARALRTARNSRRTACFGVEPYFVSCF